MTLSLLPRGFARLSPAQARLVLGGFALVATFCVAATFATHPGGSGESHPEGGDIALYRAVVDRVHAGESYYDANFAERIARGYPTQSVFNCRMPTPFWLLGYLPDPAWGKWLLVLVALAAAGTLFQALLRDDAEHPGRAFACMVVLSGPLLLCGLGEIYLMPVLWSGVLIALSVGLYGVERPHWAVVAGVAALALRELALPYCLLCILLACRERRWGELLAWAIALAAWLAFFAWHAHEVLRRVPPDALAHASGWMCLGGVTFVISTVRLNSVYLLVAPPWLAAIYFAAAMFGLAGWSSRLGTRVGLTVSLYVAALAVAGMPTNAYWGLMIAPLLALGAVRAWVSATECWRVAVPPADALARDSGRAHK